MNPMKKKQNRRFLWFVFILYCALMLWLLFDRPTDIVPGIPYEDLLLRNVNLKPLFTIRNYLYVVIHRSNDAVLMHCIINLLGNVLLFIPAGWMMPMLWKKLRKFFRFFIISIAVIFIVEVVQLFTLRGCFDVDDILLNVSGMLLGFILYHIFKKR